MLSSTWGEMKPKLTPELAEFKKLESYDTKEFDLYGVELSNGDIKKGLILPTNPSKELAEFIGILTGDGHVAFHRRERKVYISGNLFTDYDYLMNYVTNLTFKLFNVRMKFLRRNGTNAIIIYSYSKGLVSFLSQVGYYKRNTEIRIPYWIKNNSDLWSCFLRGLFDTDGSVFVSDKRGSPKYPCIELTTACLSLAQNVKHFLKVKGFRVAKIRTYQYAHSKNFSYKVSVYGWDNALKWLQEIGFSNKYKLNRAIRSITYRWERRDLFQYI